MKAVLLILTAVSILPFSQAEDVLPPDVQRVVDQRAAAVAKIDKIYLQELEKLKVSYTKQGNLEAANKIVKLAQGLESQQLMGESIEDFLAGEWLVTSIGESTIYPRSFNKEYMIDQKGIPHPWSHKEGTVIINWGPGLFEKLTINRSSPDSMSFINNEGVRGTYSRKKKRSK